MLSFLMSLALLLSPDPGTVNVTETPSPDAAAAEETIGGACASELEVDETAVDPDPSIQAVPPCALTFCYEPGTRCDYTGVDNRRNCCKYDCYQDPSCTTGGVPPNVCRKSLPL